MFSYFIQTTIQHLINHQKLLNAELGFCRKLIKWVQYFQNQLSLDTVMQL